MMGFVLCFPVPLQSVLLLSVFAAAQEQTPSRLYSYVKCIICIAETDNRMYIIMRTMPSKNPEK